METLVSRSRNNKLLIIHILIALCLLLTVKANTEDTTTTTSTTVATLPETTTATETTPTTENATENPTTTTVTSTSTAPTTTTEVVTEKIPEIERRELEKADLAALEYDQLHRLAVKDQVRFFHPPQKSIHTRSTVSLNGIYDFCFDDANLGFAEKWHSANLRHKCQPENFHRIPVPAAFNDILSNETAREYVGWFWYQKIVYLSEQQLSAGNIAPHWFLQFANVNYLTLVWIQPFDDDTCITPPAQLLGSHVGGHLPFIFNLTEIVGRSKRDYYGFQFRLTVAVSNVLTDETIPSGHVKDLSKETGQPHYKLLEPDFDFFFFAGIMGNVDLLKLNPTHISHVDLLPAQPDQASNTLQFQVCLNEHSLMSWKDVSWVQIVAQLLRYTDGSRTVVGTEIVHLHPPEERACHTIRLKSYERKSHPTPWTPANGDPSHQATMYVARFRLACLRYEDSYKFDSDLYEMRVGFGTSHLLEATGTAPGSQLQGFGMHMEQLFGGRHMSESAIAKDIHLVKQMGANIIRTSHYPYSDEFLDACDEHGIMVIGECAAVALKSFSEAKLELHKQLLLEMVRRDHHRPSIMAWSVANEPESQLPAARAYFESLLEFARTNLSSYISNKPLTAAIAQSHDGDTIGQMLDLVMVNRYYGWYDYPGTYQAVREPLLASLRGWAARLPGKPLLLSEFGADTVQGLHSWTKTIYSEEYQRELLAQHERLFDELAANRSATDGAINFWGSMVWNFADFTTQRSLLRVGSVNRKGLFTAAREPKEAALFIRQVYLGRLAPGAAGSSAAGLCSRTHAYGFS